MANVLLLVDTHALHIGTVRDHISALEGMSGHDVCVAEVRTVLTSGVPLQRFDVLVFHYSLVICLTSYVSLELRALARAYDGLKVLLIQDEYRWINDTASAAAILGIDVIFSVVPKSLFGVIYGDAALASVRKEPTLTGFVPEQLLQHPVAPYGQRTIDVGYRGRTLPFWLGAFAQEKKTIGERFAEDARRHALLADIAVDEQSRLYKNEWIDFVARCRAVLGTESGASVCDFSGNIQRNVEAYTAANPDADFHTVQDLFFKELDGKHIINVISPRCFEAAALRTLMILYPGDYSGLLQPWRHYVPLAKDHSNIDDVVAVLRSPDKAGEIINRAYDEVACNPANSFRSFVTQFDRVVREELAARRIAEVCSPPTRLERIRLAWSMKRYAMRGLAWRFTAPRIRGIVPLVARFTPSLVHRALRKAVRTAGLTRGISHEGRRRS